MLKRIATISQLLETSGRRFPLTLLDVGASGGLQERWSLLRKYLRVIGVEPDLEAFNKLVSASEYEDVFLNTALGAAAKDSSLNIAKQRECSSLYPPNHKVLLRYNNPERFFVESNIRVAVNTLDSELESKGVHSIDFIKLDVQGSELDILSGGRKILQTVFGVEVEVEFQPLYSEQPLFGDIDKYLRSSGFELIDIARHFWRRKDAGNERSYRGQLVWGDALYFRSVESWVISLDKCQDEEETIAMMSKAVAICLLYGYPDYALSLIKECKDRMPDHLYKLLSYRVHLFMKHLPSVPDFRGKTRLANLFHQLYSMLSNSKVNCDDMTLGN
jgi:FkbM family methyltransferase